MSLWHTNSHHYVNPSWLSPSLGGGLLQNSFKHVFIPAGVWQTRLISSLSLLCAVTPTMTESFLILHCSLQPRGPSAPCMPFCHLSLSKALTPQPTSQPSHPFRFPRAKQPNQQTVCRWHHPFVLHRTFLLWNGISVMESREPITVASLGATPAHPHLRKAANLSHLLTGAVSQLLPQQPGDTAMTAVKKIKIKAFYLIYLCLVREGTLWCWLAACCFSLIICNSLF